MNTQGTDENAEKKTTVPEPDNKNEGNQQREETEGARSGPENSHRPGLQGARRPKDWEMKIIKRHIEWFGNGIGAYFRSEDPPDSLHVRNFFTMLITNLREEGIRQGRDAVQIDTGFHISQKEALEKRWKQLGNASDRTQEAWEAFEELNPPLKAFNKHFGLPANWDLRTLVEQRFGQRPKESLTGLDALEAMTRELLQMNLPEKALYWWTTGCGTQVFVQIEVGGVSTYRIRAGSYLPYDKSIAKYVNRQMTRGKIMEKEWNKYGYETQVRKYTRDDIHKLVGVGWKVQEEESGTLNGNPLDLIKPEMGNGPTNKEGKKDESEKKRKFPQTLLLIEWNDGDVTLETRTVLRRLYDKTAERKKGKGSMADWMIYLAAKEQEEKYRQASDRRSSKFGHTSTQRPRERQRSEELSSLDDAEITGNSKPPTSEGAQSHEWTKPLVYPPQGKRKAEVDGKDLDRLAYGEYLNDNLIALYLRFLEDYLERKKPDVAGKIYFFNSYFFATLTEGKREINYERVQKWTKNVDLFDYDYVIVPINKSDHWYVAVICHLSSLKKKQKQKRLESSVLSGDQPVIITFDSLGQKRPLAIRALRAYLIAEARFKQSLELDSNDIKGMTAKGIPLQAQRFRLRIAPVALYGKIRTGPGELHWPDTAEGDGD